MLTTIPFAGFYESSHDANLDYALESIFWNDQGDTNSGLVARVYDTCI